MSSIEAAEGFDNPYSICGFLGGVVFALALVPQIWKTYRTKSTQDLSYLWQITYLCGYAGLGVYAIAYNLWPLLGPGIADFALMILLTLMKVYYDFIYPKKRAKVVKVDVDPKEDEGTGEVGVDVESSVGNEGAGVKAPLAGDGCEAAPQSQEQEHVVVSSEEKPLSSS